MALVKSAVEASTFPTMAIFWPNVQADIPQLTVSPTDAPPPWAQVRWQHNNSVKQGIGQVDGKSRYENQGVLTIELYLVGGRGLLQNAELTTHICNAFRGVRGPSGILYKFVKPNDIGVVALWFRTDVVVEFYYDEFK
jgi:hypothetical protein